jgi:ABC-type molybdate transport system permease subunit
MRWRAGGFPAAVLNGLVHLPLILPPVVTGYLLLLTFGTTGRWAACWRNRHRFRLSLDRRGAWPRR